MHPTSQIFTIKEASQIARVSKHSLRYWEKELEGIIVPYRTKGGQRRYSVEQLFVIEEIKNLKRRGLSLMDIKNKLNLRHSPTGYDLHSKKIDLFAERISQIVKSAIYSFLKEKTRI